MAHFAEINNSNIVLRVNVVDDKNTQDENGDEVESVGVTFITNLLGGTWKRTSSNTYGGIHKLGGTPFRKNYAGIGFTYDETRDAFYEPQPFSSWTLNEDTCHWDAPTAMPDDGKVYDWNEDTTTWDEVTE